MKKLFISILLVLICTGQAVAFSGILAGIIGAGTSGGGAATQTLYPTAQTGGDNWFNTGTGTVTANGYLLLNDSDDATGMYTYSNDTSQRFTVDAPTTCTGTINKITLISKMIMTGSSATTHAQVRLNAYYNATNHYSGYNSVTTTLTDYSYDFATGPSGGKWTASEISGSSFGIRSGSTGLSNGVNMLGARDFKVVVTCD